MFFTHGFHTIEKQLLKMLSLYAFEAFVQHCLYRLYEYTVTTLKKLYFFRKMVRSENITIFDQFLI